MKRKRLLRGLGVGISLGLVAIALLFLRPYPLLTVAAKLSPEVTFFVATKSPEVFLTIDDAPDPETTPQILDVLQKHDARATFFIIGELAKKSPDLLERIVAEGHELGNHTMQDRPSIRLTQADLQQSIDETHHILSAVGEVKWFRPASGWYSSAMLDVAWQYNYRTALGSIFPFDTHIHSVDFAVKYILGNVRPGAIVVLHDGGDRGTRTAATLERVLPELSDRGYRVTSLL